jgi:hypothetical protein
MGPKAEQIARSGDDRVVGRPEPDRERDLRRGREDDGKSRRIGNRGEGRACVLTTLHVRGLEVMLYPVRNDSQLQNEQQERDKPRSMAHRREHVEDTIGEVGTRQSVSRVERFLVHLRDEVYRCE